MLTLFPFEADYYRKYLVPVTFVGHPIADEIDPNVNVALLRKSLGINARQLVALLPGSRNSELKSLGSLFIDVANALYEQHRDIEFIAPFADDETKSYFATLLRMHRSDLPIQLVKGMSRQAIAASDVALLASGTAALEAALLGKPMVVTYKVSWLTGVLVKMFAHVRYFSMPNNLLEQPVVPELLQHDATLENLTTAVSRFLDDATLRDEVSNRLANIYDMLKKNASDRAAEVILDIAG
jgi:lipid-A-disaccharide synthase